MGSDKPKKRVGAMSKYWKLLSLWRNGFDIKSLAWSDSHQWWYVPGSSDTSAPISKVGGR